MLGGEEYSTLVATAAEAGFADPATKVTELLFAAGVAVFPMRRDDGTREIIFAHFTDDKFKEVEAQLKGEQRTTTEGLDQLFESDPVNKDDFSDLLAEEEGTEGEATAGAEAEEEVGASADDQQDVPGAVLDADGVQQEVPADAAPTGQDFVRLVELAGSMNIPEPDEWVLEHIVHLGGAIEKSTTEDGEVSFTFLDWDWERNNKVAQLIGEVAPTYLEGKKDAAGKKNKSRGRGKKKGEQAATGTESQGPQAADQGASGGEETPTVLGVVEELTGELLTDEKGMVKQSFAVTDDNSMERLLRWIRAGQMHIESVAEEAAAEIKRTLEKLNFLQTRYEHEVRQVNEPKILLERKADGDYKRKSVAYPTAGGRVHFVKSGGWRQESREDFLEWLSKQTPEVQAEFGAKTVLTYDYHKAAALAEKYKPVGWSFRPVNQLAHIAYGGARKWTVNQAKEKLKVAWQSAGVGMVEDYVDAEVIDA